MKNTKNTIETIATLELAEDLNFLTTTESFEEAKPFIEKYKTFFNLPNNFYSITIIVIEIGKELARRIIEDDKKLVEYTNNLEKEENFSNK